MGSNVGASVGCGSSLRMARNTSVNSGSFVAVIFETYRLKSSMIRFKAVSTLLLDGAGIRSNKIFSCITITRPGMFSFLRPLKDLYSSTKVSAAPCAISI